jgi:hypothetical protein
MNTPLSLIAFGPLVALLSYSTANASTTIKIVADNDFAVYTGDETSISRVIYHNNVIWGNQLSAASTFTFDLLTGETMFYLLAMGGSGGENISGKINDVNIVDVFQNDPSTVSRSTAIQSLLSSYNLGTVSNGTYTPDLASAQAALAGATFGTPVVDISATVITSNPEAATLSGTRSGFSFGDSTAVFFRFGAASVGVPEPSSMTLVMGLSLLSLIRRRR